VPLAACATVAINSSILEQVGHVVLAFLVAPGETRKSRGGFYRSLHASLISFVSCFRYHKAYIQANLIARCAARTQLLKLIPFHNTFNPSQPTLYFTPPPPRGFCPPPPPPEKKFCLHNFFTCLVGISQHNIDWHLKWRSEESCL